jgi:hypothetical protein
MMNIDPMSFNSDGMSSPENGITKLDINFSVETPEMIIGAVLVSSKKAPEDTVVGKIFIYKYTTPNFIEVNFDETYIGYLFDNPASASYEISNYTLKMLTIDFPSSILNLASSTDIGMVQLPQGINK